MHHKTVAIRRFKEIMEIHETHGVSLEFLLVSVLSTFQVLNPEDGRTVTAALDMRAYNYALHVKKLDSNPEAMRQEVAELAKKAADIKAKFKKGIPSEEFTIIEDRLYTLINCLYTSNRTKALTEIVSASPKANLFAFMEKYPMALRQAYHYAELRGN